MGFHRCVHVDLFQGRKELIWSLSLSNLSLRGLAGCWTLLTSLSELGGGEKCVDRVILEDTSEYFRHDFIPWLSLLMPEPNHEVLFLVY